MAMKLTDWNYSGRIVVMAVYPGREALAWEVVVLLSQL
jgi:hypothetical protein